MTAVTTNDEIRERILHLTLALVKTQGWHNQLLAQVARENDLDIGYIRCLFPQMECTLMAYFLNRGNRWLASGALEKPEGFQSWRLDKKIAWTTMQRLCFDHDYKKELKGAVAALTWQQPHRVPLSIYETVDSIWRFVQDSSVDFNFYTKRLTLGAIYTNARIFWFQDGSADYIETQQFLERQMALTPLIGKIKSKLSTLASKLAGPSFQILRGCRYSRNG